MAIGNKEKNDSTELVIIRDGQSEDKRKSFFDVIQKNGDEWVTTQKTDRFSGDFKSLKRGLKYDPSVPRQKELIEKFGNKPVITISLVDHESNQTYVYKFSLRLSTRTLINRLVNLKSGDNLEISIWNDKEKGYENFSLRQNGELVKWKYSLDEVPRAEEIRKKDGTLVSRDFKDVDQFFLDQVDNFKLKASPTAIPLAPKQKVVIPEILTDLVDNGDDDSDSIPF